MTKPSWLRALVRPVLVVWALHLQPDAWAARAGDGGAAIVRGSVDRAVTP